MALTQASVPVSAIMTRDLFTVHEETSLAEVYDLFRKARVRHLPVVRDGILTGIISQTDILRLSFGSNFGQGEVEVDEAIFEMLSLSQVMANHPRTINANDSVEDTARLFTNVEFHALPVLDHGKLVGIVTTTDIIRYYLDGRSPYR